MKIFHYIFHQHFFLSFLLIFWWSQQRVTYTIMMYVVCGFHVFWKNKERNGSRNTLQEPKERDRGCWKSFAKCQDDEMQVRTTDTLHGDKLKGAQFMVLELLSCKMATISHFVISSMTLFQIPRGRCIRASMYPNFQLTRKNITYII